jgi:hypothetical protein
MRFSVYIFIGLHFISSYAFTDRGVAPNRRFKLIDNQKGLKDRYVKAQGKLVNRRIYPVKGFYQNLWPSAPESSFGFLFGLG